LVVFGADKIGGLPDNATLSDKYQTLITPAPYAFAIWGIIFTSELVFVIAQALPAYRSHPIVIKAVSYNFALASLAQCLWTIAFGIEYLLLSLIFMIGIFLPLLRILFKTASTHEFPAVNKKEYWLLKFPFEIHGAWILAATCLNINVLFVGAAASAKVQTVVGWTCLAVLFGAGVYAVVKKQNYDRVWTIPCVVAWASFAISRELTNPRELIVNTFEASTIQHTKVASIVVVVALLFLVVVTVFVSNTSREVIEASSEAAATTTAEETEDNENEGSGGRDAGGEYTSLNDEN